MDHVEIPQTTPTPHYPSGTVTFLFTDVEGSTRRWEQDSPAMLAAVERHFSLLDDAIRDNHGVRFKTIGDAVQAAFPTAVDALNAAVAAQRALAAADWGVLGPIAVRMALHTGSATPRDGDYLAPALNRLARMLATAVGGQMLMSEATKTLVRDILPHGVQLRDLGEHRLRDLREVEHVFQIDAAGLPSAFPPLKSLDRPLHNLPTQLTAFVGREQDVSDIRRRLEEPGLRLLTLTGPGGAGKTRLALQVAADLLAAHPDGVWFVPLASVSSAGRVASAVADTLGLRESAGEAIEETLRAYLQPRHTLLVLDNVEHLIDAAPLVSRLLAAAPALHVLATSRVPLRIAGEHEFAVRPLGLPDDDGALTVEAALASEAVRLFVDRARAVRGDFVLSEGNARIVAAICRRLDGLPLAIELAAARIKLLSPEAILARLDNRLSLLTGGGRDRPERQQTLRAAIAWSHDLLEPSEQALFQRLAVFVGGWTIEAAEAVVADNGEARFDLLDGLTILNDNSLIRQDENLGYGEPRFTMLQTIQEFAREQLARGGDEERVRHAHASHFSAFASQGEPHLTDVSSVAWLDRLDADHDNLRAALRWFRDQHNGEVGARMAAALWRFWWLRGHISEGREHLESALSAVDASNEPAVRAAALDGAGVLAETQGDYDQAEMLHQEALALSRHTENETGVARALGNLGVVALDRGDSGQAEALLRESLALARDTADEHMIATALNDLGGVAFVRGELEQAEALYRESLALRRRSSSDAEIARTVNNLGVVARRLGAFGQARELFEESLHLYQTVGDDWGAAGAQTGLALTLREEGDIVRATGLFEESLELFRETGDTQNSARTLLSLAETAREGGDWHGAAAYYRQALAGFQAVGGRNGIADSLLGLGGVLVSERRFDAAARLLGAAAALLPPPEAAVLLDAERYQAAAAAIQSALGDDAFAAARSAGEAMSLDDAIATANANPDQ